VFPVPPPLQCPDCNARYWPGEPHECDVDTKFIHQQEKQRRAELAAAVAELDEEFSHPDKVAATLEAWSENATLPPCPDEDAANVSIDALRQDAEWQRKHEKI
jgi:hypothetical protein